MGTETLTNMRIISCTTFHTLREIFAPILRYKRLLIAGTAQIFTIVVSGTTNRTISYFHNNSITQYPHKYKDKNIGDL